jgi:aminoglycoside phosphotransferase family enzyme/predicted kinase
VADGCLRISDDQEAVVAFLRDPTSYGAGVHQVDVIETHISLVFLAGDRAYKLKRAIKYPYLDFSTEAKRRQACEAEVTLNRRTAPDLYLEARAVSGGADGSIGWGEAGRVLDWVVVMRRFDQDLLFDSLAQRGTLSAPLMRNLVDHVVSFHASAERLFSHGGAAAVAAVEQSNTECLRQSGSRFFEPAHIADLHRRSLEPLTTLSGLLDARRAAGKVRRCHGDLHLRNICLLDGKPVVFDCIEFSDEIASIDVLYDLAFLLMDLEYRNLEDLANQVFNRYLDLTDEDDGLAALPLFISMRAAVRAHVTAMAANCGGLPDEVTHRAIEARRYLDLARTALHPHSPRLIAIGGLSGTGKSTIARMLAPTLGTWPGARVLRSDVIRKRLWGVMPETRLPPAAYQPDMSRRVYDMIRQTAAALRAGYCAIIDAVSLTKDERRSFAAVAKEAGVPFSGIWLHAAPDVMAARLGARHDDPSDASTEVLQQQLQRDPGPIDWPLVDVGGDCDSSVVAVRRTLGLP